MWHSSQPSDGIGDASSALPQKPGAPDCLFYVRTGRCDYGINCRFNHPPKIMLDEAPKKREEYPEQVGQPECQFYLKTGNCKFGSTCKYHHPKEKAGILGKTIATNGAGYPLRLGEKDCAYYTRFGTCRFGMFCRFNHPQPAFLSAIMAGFEAPLIAKEPYMQGLPLHSSCYTPCLVPPEGSMLGWTPYQDLMRPVVHTSQLNMQQTYEVPAIYGGASRNICPLYSPYVVGSASTRLVNSNSLPKDSNFPLRPGQPECKYYIKTGDCKFGASCHFDHPKRWIFPRPDCGVSSQGLPDRPGIQPCGYYMQYGTCKYGTSCRFDHPTTSFTYSPFPKSLVNCHLLPYPQNFPFPKLFHSPINTVGGANGQQWHKDSKPALVEEQSLAPNKGLESGELKDSLNGGGTKAST